MNVKKSIYGFFLGCGTGGLFRRAAGLIFDGSNTDTPPEAALSKAPKFVRIRHILNSGSFDREAILNPIIVDSNLTSDMGHRLSKPRFMFSNMPLILSEAMCYANKISRMILILSKSK